MIFLKRQANWDNRDYRDYCDHRARQKRRLRLRMTIGLTLMVCILLVAAWAPTVSVYIRAQPMKVAPGLSAPIR